MVAFNKKEAFIKQITIYINSKDYQKAYELSKGLAGLFPNEMISHFLLAKSSFWLGKYEETVSEGKRAFHLSKLLDMVPCAVILASGYYQLKKYQEGYKFLNALDIKNDVDLQRLKFLFAVAVGDEKAARDRVEELFGLNKKIASDFIEKILLNAL